MWREVAMGGRYDAVWQKNGKPDRKETGHLAKGVGSRYYVYSFAHGRTQVDAQD